MSLDLETVGKFLGGGFILVIVVCVALLSAVKVLRSDHTYTRVIGTLDKQLEAANRRADAQERRADAAESRFARKVDELGDRLTQREHEIEDLRGALQHYTIHQRPAGDVTP